MTEESGSNWLASFMADGGAIGTVIGREASRALGVFVGQVLQVPGAYFAGKAREISADSDARVLIRSALAERAAELAVGDPAIVDRGLHRWASELLTKQQHRETIGTIAIEDLRKNPPSTEEAVDDDFLNRFGDHAERASSEEMQFLFGRVLAGEIRKPGSYSLQTLHLLSIMDRRVATNVDLVAPYVLDDFVLVPERLLGDVEGFGLAIEDLHIFGLLATDAISAADLIMGRSAHVRSFRRQVGSPTLHIAMRPEGRDRLSVVKLTATGKEIFGLADPQYTEEHVRNIAALIFNAVPGVSEIQPGEVELADGQLVSGPSGPFAPPLIRH